jgi:hypothetical protein
MALIFVKAVTGLFAHSGSVRLSDRTMPFLIGSATLACTLLSLSLGQVPMGMQALGVILASAVVMSLQRE